MQADLSLRSTYMSFCWFCLAAAQLCLAMFLTQCLMDYAILINWMSPMFAFFFFGGGGGAFLNKFLLVNTVDPDKTPHSDLGLHCLLTVMGPRHK